MSGSMLGWLMDHFDSLESSSVSQMHMFLPPRLAHSLKILRLELNKKLQGQNAKKKKQLMSLQGFEPVFCIFPDKMQGGLQGTPSEQARALWPEGGKCPQAGDMKSWKG